MSRTLAGILGGAGALPLLFAIFLAYLIWTKLCVSKRNSVSRTSETGSSDPSVQAGRHAGVELSIHEAKRFDMEELSLATTNFSQKKLIGVGKFGKAWYLSAIQHRNIVTLLGYCEENTMQFLIYEYVPSGSVSSHLYGSGQVSKEKLEFKHRLAIALGAAKGDASAKSVSILAFLVLVAAFQCLDYLHSLRPRLVHKNFETANVLVDENFIAKVADAGLRNFLGRVESAGPSSQVTDDEIFLAPEVREFRRFSEKSDVYSFGVFLVESNGREGIRRVEGRMVDERLGSSFTAEEMEEHMRLAERCLEASSERRPGMSQVVMELDRILEKEMKVTTGIGEGTAPTVTLGSHLFRP
ncbi:Probable receptor-like protein kinase At1g30570 [Linum grandiflorum]